MTDLRSLDDKRLNYKKLSTSGERVYVDSVRKRVQEPLDDTYDEVLEEVILAEEVQSTNMSDAEGIAENEERMKELIAEERSREMHVHKQIQDQAVVTQLASQVDAKYDDIIDFIEENPIVHTSLSIGDMDAITSKIEELRSQYRSKSRELGRYIGKNYEINYLPSYNSLIDTIKNYIKQIKDKRNHSRLDEDLARNDVAMHKAKKLEFLITETKRRLSSLEQVFGEDLSEILDEDITSRKGALSDHQREMQHITKCIQDLIEAGADEHAVSEINLRYVDLNSSKSEYVLSLDQESKIREIEKQKSFNKSALNINLGKFKGYNSKTDIFTFQDQFNKLYLKGTPKSMLPDVLINKHLEGAAQLLVKSNKDIDDIWVRLKEVYGDIKTLLANKLSELNNIEQLSRQREPAKIVDALSKLIHLMKDLLQLAKRHNIENKLYYGGGIDKVYQMMGEHRLNRWLTIAEVQDEGENQWLEVVEFLEKELRVNQQKVNIFSSSSRDSSSSSNNPRDSSQSRNNSNNNSERTSYHTGDTSRRNSRDQQQDTRDQSNRDQDNGDRPVANGGICSFCGEPDHVPTSGPGGVMLIQYFACKKFVDLSPAERFQTLRAKGYCIQCLFPGADCTEEKHAEGRCQRDFVCKHTSHERHTVKKHVLVCEDHKNTNENKQLLQKYKTRCILRRNSSNLQQFSRDIQLSHYVSSVLSQVQPNAEGNDAVRDPAVQFTDSVHYDDGTTSGMSMSTYSNSNGEDTTTEDATSNPDEGDDCLLDEDDEDDEFNVKDDGNGVYILQTIKVGNHLYTLFYDNGCGKFCLRFSATQRLGRRAKQRNKKPCDVSGISGAQAQARHGIWSVKLPLANGEDATMSGACFDQITETFPMYPLKGVIEEDIRTAYHEAGNDVRDLPDLPQFVGGDPDFMVGSKFMKYFPVEQFRLPSGLTIYKSMFENPDGSTGVIGGPHWLISQIEEQHYHRTMAFLTSQRQMYNDGFQVNPDVSVLGYKNDFNDVPPDPAIHGIDVYHAQGSIKRFEEAENAGSVINYRCPDCRGCKNCKKSEQTEEVSIKNEVGQHIIESCVKVDIEQGVTSADMPLTGDPAILLAPNKDKALKVYHQQLKRLWKDPTDAEALIKSEKKLQDLGFVDWVENLSPEVQRQLRENPIQNFIPWRVAWKDSMTTPCRMVFDASQPTASGYSLNDITPKGINMLNNLVEIFIRWRMYRHGFHCDIQKMYNAIRLNPEYWCLQRYLYQKDLSTKIPPEVKVIKTSIYGVTSSGNVAQCGLRKTAEIHQEEFPSVYEVISKDTYVDDCMSGAQSWNESNQIQDEIKVVLATGGFELRDFTVSGKDPPEELTKDGKSIGTFGVRWYSKNDEIGLDIKALNFAKKVRGRKAEAITEVPGDLTKWHCASKLGEIYDLPGFATPLVAGMKMDLHELNVRKLDWDDILPNNLQQVWRDHFDMMSEINNLRYQRAVIPDDAVSLDVSTLDFGDASTSLVCAAIYVRFEKKNGEFSCQLIFSRSKLVPDGMTQPRAELFAALLCTHTGEIVRRALHKFHQKAFKFTDSQIALYWLTNEDIVLKQWTRSRVVEILRLTEKSSWWYVCSEDMIADIGTRRCTSTDVVHPDGIWMKGYDWMRGAISSFPMSSAKEITLNNQQMQSMKKETQESIFRPMRVHHVTDQEVEMTPRMKKFLEHYKFSNYLLDPCHRRFEVTVNIYAYVLRYVRNLHEAAEARKASTSQSTQSVEPPSVTDNESETLSSIINAQEPLSETSSSTNESPLTPVSEFKAPTISDSEIKELISTSVPLLSDEEVNRAKNYYFRKATLEIKKYLKPSQYENISTEVEGILRFNGRILPDDDISIVGRATKVMKDLTASTFFVPIIEKNSPIALSIIEDIHWNHPTAQHRGVETVWRYVLKEAFIIDGRSLVVKIRESCERCRVLNKKSLQVIMGPVSPDNLVIAPAFYVTQVDLAGPFQAHCHHHKRNTIKIWFSVFCCATTSTTSIKLMEDYSTSAFINSFIRLSSDVGFPKKMICDSGSQIIKACESMNLKFRDLQFQLRQESAGIEFDICPVGGHNMNGRVERKIREIRKSLEISLNKDRLSIMQWETLASTISNQINNMPIALGSSKANLEALDILTPNRLKIGRNNERSPEGHFTVTHYEKTIEQNILIFSSWFEIWLSCHVPTLLSQQKWYKSEKDLQPGDVVLFLKDDSELSLTYQYGIVENVEKTRDGKVRKVNVRYRNANENTDRTTYRAARSLVLIRRADESSIMDELGEVSRYIEADRKLNRQ